MYKISHVDIATIELLSNNIFHITVKADADIDLDNAKGFVRGINEMLPNDNSYRAGIIDLSKMSNIQVKAIAYLVSGEDLNGTVTGVALISSTVLGRTIGDAIVSIHDPQTFPIQFFSSPIRAEHWLRTNMKNRLRILSPRDEISTCKSVA